MSLLDRLRRLREPAVRIEATVIRCACGNPDSHVPNPCPQGRLEELGVIAKGDARWIAASNTERTS
jgi:hypothetical protein